MTYSVNHSRLRLPLPNGRLRWYDAYLAIGIAGLSASLVWLVKDSDCL